ncbi:MAG: transposase [Endozoicomonadaceae bacterium]|nr:transposase [Endozoicomonadaceae bacterium]
MPHFMLTDEYWSKLSTIFSQIKIYNKSNLRLVVEGMLYRIRVGCPWRDLPADLPTCALRST